MNLPHIIIIDDDLEIRSLLSEILIRHDFLVSAASSIREADALMECFIFDLVILDVMMPQENGLSLLARMNKNQPPIIMLTAMAGVDDRINGLELGAADYLGKPFEIKELILRIKNLLLRSEKTLLINNYVSFGDYKFNVDSGILLKKDARVYLTTNEQNLLQILAKKYGRTVSREYIIQSSNEFMTERTVDAQVARLRSKIESNPKNPLYLHTIRHKGYKLLDG